MTSGIGSVFGAIAAAAWALPSRVDSAITTERGYLCRTALGACSRPALEQATMKPTTPSLLDTRNRAEFRARAAEAGVKQAQGDLARVQAQRKYADAQRQRIEPQARVDIASRDELDAARSNAQTLAETEDAGAAR